jgi:monovalent cation:H+ antiporter, CPA1 family
MGCASHMLLPGSFKMTNENIIFIEELIVILLLIASGVAVVTRRWRLPYTVGLVLIGFVITLFNPQRVEFTPQIIMLLLVPPLIFEAAFHIRIDDLRNDFWLIVLLAVPGVLLTTFLVGWLVSWGTGLALQAALVFGALIAATDPIAVVALFRRLGAPHRLQVVLESESLLNDGTAIVMFGIMISTALQGNFDLRQGISQFITVSGGGVLVGLILGLSISQFTKRIDEPLVETTLTTALAFGSYLLAESLHVSGVLAVVTAGIISGNTSQETMSASTRLVVYNFWEYAAFVANSFIFLLIGLAIDINSLFENWQAIVWAILAALVARFVSTYAFSLFGREISAKWKPILFWGGLRGAITLALALSLPEEGIFISERGRLQAMAFGVVLFTLLVQGFSMNWLVKRLRLIVRSPAQDEYELRHARFVASRASYDYLRRRTQEGMVSEHTWQKLSPLMKKQNDVLMDEVKQVMTSDPDVEAEELDIAYREALRGQRSALTSLLHDGVITEETYSKLIGEVDEALMNENPSARLFE